MRNNAERLGARPSAEPPTPQMANPMDFVTPKEFVELPSAGKMYPQGHPLHNEETIEIRYMTAKDEDVLTSRSLLKKGLAIERLIDNLIVDKGIKAADLLVGDRNAILIAARASAYGHIYETKVNCPACGKTARLNFNLLEPTISPGGTCDEKYNVTQKENGNYVIELPHSKLLVEIKMLTGREEVLMIQSAQKKNKREVEIEDNLTGQMKYFVVSVNGYADTKTIDYVVENITARETRHLRNAYKQLSPNLQVMKHFECTTCDHEQEMEVPFNADFFWPDR